MHNNITYHNFLIHKIKTSMALPIQRKMDKKMPWADFSLFLHIQIKFRSLYLSSITPVSNHCANVVLNKFGRN